MKKINLKILLPAVGILLMVVSVLAFQGVLAGIGFGIAGLLVFGPNVEDIRGKTGGIVYVRGKTGPYTKARIKGKNPKTDAQQANRAMHAKYMRLWKSTEVNQLAFIAYAESHPVQNKLGRTSYISGINWFVKFNRYAQKANPGVATITSPPTKETIFPVLTGVELTATVTPEGVIVTPIKIGDYVEGMRLEVMATRQMSYGVFSPFGFRSLGVYNPSLSETIDITADYVARFKELKAGMKIFVRARLIMQTGEVVPFTSGNAVIQLPITND